MFKDTYKRANDGINLPDGKKAELIASMKRLTEERQNEKATTTVNPKYMALAAGIVVVLLSAVIFANWSPDDALFTEFTASSRENSHSENKPGSKTDSMEESANVSVTEKSSNNQVSGETAEPQSILEQSWESNYPSTLEKSNEDDSASNRENSSKPSVSSNNSSTAQSKPPVSSTQSSQEQSKASSNRPSSVPAMTSSEAALSSQSEQSKPPEIKPYNANVPKVNGNKKIDFQPIDSKESSEKEVHAEAPSEMDRTDSVACNTSDEKLISILNTLFSVNLQKNNSSNYSQNTGKYYAETSISSDNRFNYYYKEHNSKDFAEKFDNYDVKSALPQLKAKATGLAAQLEIITGKSEFLNSEKNLSVIKAEIDGISYIANIEGYMFTFKTKSGGTLYITMRPDGLVLSILYN